MKHHALVIGLTAALLGIGASLPTALAVTQTMAPTVGGLVTPQPSVGESLAKKIADTLRARSASQRSAFYQDLNGRSRNVRFPDIDVVLELPSPARVGGGEGATAELDLLIPEGVTATTPFAVFAAPSSDDDELSNPTLVGYDLGSGQRITRTRLQLERGSQPFMVVDPAGQLALRAFVAQTNAQLAELGLGGLPAVDTTAKQPDARSAAKNLPGGAGPGKRYTSSFWSVRADKTTKEWHGKAEVYVVSSCYGGDGKLQIVAHDLAFFDDRYHTYFPDEQNFFQWAWEPTPGNTQWYTSSTCGLLFMERDNGDHTAVIAATLNSAEQILNAVGQPMVAQIVGALDGMVAAFGAQGWFTNKDDYLDKVGTIEPFLPSGENKKHGVLGNIHVHFIDKVWGYHNADVELHPDLRVNALVTQNGSFRPGQDLTVALSVGNIGLAATQPWSADFHLIPAGGGAPIKLATGNGPAVAAGANWMHQFPLKLPAGLRSIPPGHYQLRVDLDVPADADEGNNQAMAVNSWIKVLPAQAGGFTLGAAELVPHYLATVGGNYQSTQAVQTLFEVRNTGGESSAFEAYFWAQNQSTGEIRYLAKGSSGQLNSGGSYATSINVPLTGLSLGQWRMWMQVAATDGEQSTANNFKTAPGTFTIVAGGVVGN